MKLSYRIAKGRRTVLKISPPKNPRIYTGAAIRGAWRSRAARGRGTASALIPADADLAVALPIAALATCAASWRCLPVRRRSRSVGAHRSSALKARKEDGTVAGRAQSR